MKFPLAAVCLLLSGMASSAAVPVISALTATPQPATTGQPVTVSWSVTGADSLILNGSEVTGQSSSIIAAPGVPQSWTLTARNAEGPTTRSVFVDVLPAPLPPAAVRINEVLSNNTSGLQDEDASYQDWMELYNTTSAAVDLTGWHLTDDPALPSRWTFPAVTLPAQGYLIVFASGKNRSVPGRPLHTSFKLGSSGEYLALTNPSGATVSVFAPVPGLGPDQAYGYGTGNTRVPGVVSPDNAALKWQVPAAPVSDDWRGGAPFDDTAWTPGRWSLGYGNVPTNPYAVAAGTVGTQAYAGSLGMDFEVLRPVIVTDLACFDSGSNGLSRTITVVLWSRNQKGTPASTADDTQGSVLASMVFSATNPGTLNGGQRFKPLAVPVNLAPGSYTILAYNYGSTEPNGNSSAFGMTANDGGGALRFSGTSRYGATQPPASVAASWPATPDGGPAVLYAAGSFLFSESSGTATSTETAMKGVNASVLTRTEFATATLPHCPVLNVTYDDGFVAWLNGVEIARRNAPPALLHNATATTAQNATARIPLDNFSSIFKGANVLAVQGLNAAADDSDFLLRVSITGEAGGTVAGFLSNPTPGSANAGVRLADKLVINEIHSDPPDSKFRFAEFIELYNPLGVAVNAGGWSVTGGISYTIPDGTSIPACGYLVIAENPVQLQAATGYAGALGPWTGSLRNEGDEIVLRDAAPAVVDRVRYGLGFPWPTVGDDPGDSMQRIHEGLEGNLGASWRSALPTPGARNTVTTGTAPPAVRQVEHAPVAPKSGEGVTITAKITDPEGVAAAWVEYQTVDPGKYIRVTDAAWSAPWTALALHDDGINGDLAAHDAIFTAVVPASVQVHRRLIRYRIRAWDGALAPVRVPYADDDSPNFAYFCYDGVPAWKGAVRPGVTPASTFSAATMNKVRPWHLLSNATDVQNCQFNSSYNDGTYRFEGTLVIGDNVYDHIHYRIKGQNSTFNTGKNKWKLRFNRGRALQMPDDYGLASTTVRTLNISSVPAPWAPWNRGLHGLDEAMAFRLSNLSGVPAPRTSYLQLRVIDGVAEQNPANQFDSDLWGLYLGFENTDNNFKTEHGLPDGNIFRLIGNESGNHVLGQGRGQPGDLSDLNAFTSATTGYRKGGGSATAAPPLNTIQPEAWFRANVNLPEYCSWRSVTEAINQTDRREQENVVYFRDPADGRWQILPWDCDLLYERFDRWGPQASQTPVDYQAYEQISRCLRHPAILMEFQNRARELQDLLLNSDQAWKVIDEFVSIITGEAPRIIPDGGAIEDGFAEVERRRWDYNPSNPVPPRGAGATGNYYKSPYPIGSQGGAFLPPTPRTLASADFEGMVKWVKDFIATDAHGGGRLTKMTNGQIEPYTLTNSAAIQIPATPVITYTGPAGYPLNQLQFSTSAFSSPNAQNLAAVQWRLGEIYDPSVPGFMAGQPWRFEITSVWTAGSASIAGDAQPPASGLIPGHTYRARVRHKDSLGRWSHWSPPAEFLAGAALPGNLAENLVVSGIMYNPPAPEGSDAEYVELMNIHPTAALDLTGVQFTDGISFTFPAGTMLAPGARLLVVRNAVVFAATYGAGLPVAGEYGSGAQNSLANGGERLVLSLGGSILRDFTYDNKAPWPSAPDNAGASLVLIAPQTNPDPANPLSWRASFLPRPGTSDATSYDAWKTGHAQPDDNADTDGDGLNAFLEYSLGGDPAQASSAPLPVLARQPDGSALLTFSRPLTADDSGFEIQTGNNLSGWTPTSLPLTARSQNATSDQLTFTIASSTFTGPERYWRLRFLRR